MTKSKQPKSIKILVLSVLIPDDELVFQNMVNMISTLIRNFKKKPFLGAKEVSDRINEPGKYTWEIKDKEKTIAKLEKMIRETFQSWNVTAEKFSLEIKDE